MSLPRDEKQKRRVAPPADDDTYGVSEAAQSQPRPKPAAPSVTRAEPTLIEPEEEPPEAPRLPLMTGVFTFPFYWRSMPAWLLMSFGLMLGGLSVLFCVWLADRGLYLAVRCFLPPAVLISIFAFSYAAACFKEVMDVTSQGHDEVIDWPMGLWREWVFTGVSIGWSLGLAAAPGAVLGALTPIGPWLGGLVSAHLLFPLFWLSSLESGSFFGVLVWPLWRTLRSVWWGWGFLYLVSAGLIVVWLLLTVAAFPRQPWATVIFAAPPLAAGMLIYARLLGRLVWCIGRYGDME